MKANDLKKVQNLLTTYQEATRVLKNIELVHAEWDWTSFELPNAIKYLAPESLDRVREVIVPLLKADIERRRQILMDLGLEEFD
jgi:hypothetical protein